MLNGLEINMEANLGNRVQGIIVALIVAAIIGGWNWMQDMTTRVALLEDDLTETIEVLHTINRPLRQRPKAERDVVERKRRKQSKRAKRRSQLKALSNTP